MQLLVFEDMTDELRRTNRELAVANREVKNLAITDPLTGCHNRRFFEEIERREIQRHRRYSAPLSIVFADVNHFKRFNDTMGHETGDRILTTIGTFLRRQVRESDYVIRWGGDEFLLLLTCGYAEAQRKGTELKAAFERERVAVSLPAGLGLSIGVASAPLDADSLADTIREADTRMYQDKMADRSAASAVQ
jgi:diguanylate cyclase (GGDEF)-like protein